MKKILITVAVLIFVTGVFLLNKRPVETKPVGQAALFSNFEANLEFKMVSDGRFMNSATGGGLVIQTTLEGFPIIVFDKSANLLKLTWTPSMILKVNNVLKEEYKKEFDSVKNETFYAHFNAQMVMDNIYYSKRAGLSRPVQEMVLNFNKMLAHQAAWFFVLAPQEKATTMNSVDIWGETTFSINNNGKIINVLTKSIEKKSAQVGNGNFELTKAADGSLSITGSQSSVMGGMDAAQSMASTMNQYTVRTVAYKEIGDLKIDVNLSDLEKTPPWMVVDVKAMKLATLKEKLKDWDRTKLQAAVFAFKATPGGGYKDIAEISALITDMLALDNTLAKDYYEWLKKLGPNHALYSEFIRSFSVNGCPECQNYLIQVTKDYKSDMTATQKSLIATGFLETPLESTEEEIRKLADDESFVNKELANYMVGNMAAKLEVTDPARAQKIDSDYVKKLKNSKNVNEITRNLLVLGNSGQCTDFNAIEDLAMGKDEYIKKDALMALRFCKNENVGRVYRNLFKEKPELRPNIMQASEMRVQQGIVEQEQFDYFKNWIEAPKTDSDEHEKRTIVGVLRTFSISGSHFKEQFDDIKSNCSKNNTCSLFN